MMAPQAVAIATQDKHDQCRTTEHSNVRFAIEDIKYHVILLFINIEQFELSSGKLEEGRYFMGLKDQVYKWVM